MASGRWLVVSKFWPLRLSWCAIVPAIFAGMAVATPFLLHSLPALGLALQRGFALVCHQQSQRSFFLFGGSVAVCARCLGTCLGASAGLLVRVPRSLARRWLMAAVAINALDWAAELSGVHGNWVSARFALGFALGVASAMLIASAEATKTPTQAKEA